MGIPPVNAKIVRCELQAGLVFGVNHVLVKLFILGLVGTGIAPLSDRLTMPACIDFTLFG